MKILQIKVTLHPDETIQWHVIGEAVDGQRLHAFSGPIAKALGKTVMGDLLRDLAAREEKALKKSQAS